MRTETEMHDLVVAKVAGHRRRRTLLAAGGGGVAVALLLVAVAVGASSGGVDDRVRAGEGGPTSTTEAPTTTTVEDPDPTTSTTSTSTTAVTRPATSEAPAATTGPAPTTAEPAPTTTTQPTPTAATSPTRQPTVDVIPTAEGDMEVTFTVTTDPARPGRVRVRFQLSDPTGVDVHDGGYRNGPGGSVARLDPFAGLADVGDQVASCGHGPLQGTEPGALDEEVEVELASGPQTLRLTAQTLACHDEGTQVLVDHRVDVP